MHTHHKASRAFVDLRRPPPNKLPQILPRRNAQHKPPRGIRHHRKLLLLIARRLALEESLQLLQRRFHGDQRVLAAFAAEAHHGLLYTVIR